MKSRILVLAFLLAGSAAAQIDRPNIQHIDMSTPVNAQAAARFNAAEMNYGERAFVSVSELGIPVRARKEFEKGNQALLKQDLQQAQRHLGKAIDLYPAYASAYNNLGVVFARLGQTDSEREALHHALTLNDHFALAYLNWAKMDIKNADYTDAESALGKASSLDASDPTALILLAYSELMERHFDAALANSDKAHALPKPHAFAHRVAARVYEEKGNLDLAVAELRLELEEEPVGRLADAARNELAIVQAMPH